MTVWRHRMCIAITALAALWLGGVGLVRGTWAVGGSDSSCYALMADAFARARLQPTSGLAVEAPWPDAALTLAPAGFHPSPVAPEAASPICAPGFSLLLAPFRWLGGHDGIFLVTPLAGFALVWLVFRLAHALGGPAAGALAAALVATSPIVVFQVVQPMNDVATAAASIAVLVAAVTPGSLGAALVGAATGILVLIRPNLAPVALVVGAWILTPTRRWSSGDGDGGPHGGRGLRVGTEVTRGDGGPQGGRGSLLGTEVSPGDGGLPGGRRSFRGTEVAFVAGLAPFLLAVAWLNNALYGSPVRSGYGDARGLFGLAFIPANAFSYGAAVIETQTPLPLLAMLAPLVCPRPRRALCWLALAVAGTVTAVYLLYRPFPEWWYIRFLLPALVMALALASVVVVRFLERLPGATGPLVGAAFATVLAIHGIRTALDRQAFDLHDLEARFRHAATVVRDRLPASTVVITVWDSGSIRYHAGSEAVLWDSLDPRWLDRAVEWLQARGRSPVILIERWEEPLFRQRFGQHAALGGLDWPPRFDIERQVRIFDPTDRPRYLAGELVPTEHVRR